MEPTTQGEINLRDYLANQKEKGKIIYMSLHPCGARIISREPENICYVEGHGVKAPFAEIRESFYDYLVPIYDRRAIRSAEEDAKEEAEEIEPLYTFIISQDGEEKARLEHQITDWEPFRKLQRLQGNSMDYALRYGGWKVEQINETTQESTFWQPYSRK